MLADPWMKDGGQFELRVLVDGAMIESFAAGVAIASFVTPTGTAMPGNRTALFRRADIPAPGGCVLDLWRASTQPNDGPNA